MSAECTADKIVGMLPQPFSQEQSPSPFVSGL